MTPIYQQAIGGLLLFPEVITESANTLYAPASNKPTAIASNDGYAGEDTRRGSFNGVESGEITNGFRFVWDFGTSAGNGVISCACLTSALGGAGYLDGGSNLFLHNSPERYAPAGLSKWFNIPEGNGQYGVLGGDENNLYIGTTVYGFSIYRVKTPKHKIALIGNQTPEYIGTFDARGYLYIENDNFLVVRTASSGSNSTIYFDRYNKETFEKTTTSMVVSATLRDSSNGAYLAKNGNYIWLPASQGGIYKINVDNAADVQYYGGFTVHNWGMIPFNGGAMDSGTYIEEDGTVHTLTSGIFPTLIDGVWALNGWYEGSGSWTATQVGATIFTPYLATINNLNSAVTKTAAQTMKVTYTVTEV